MKSYNLLALLSIIVIVLVSGCTTQYGSETPVKTKSQNTNVPTQTDNTVEITSSGFSPNTLNIKQGDTVMFINKDSNAHWPASDIHPTHSTYDGTSLSEHCSKGNSFDACRSLQQGEDYSFTFDKKGSWRYHDHLNPSHTGIIVVD